MNHELLSSLDSNMRALPHVSPMEARCPAVNANPPSPFKRQCSPNKRFLPGSHGLVFPHATEANGYFEDRGYCQEV